MKFDPDREPQSGFQKSTVRDVATAGGGGPEGGYLMERWVRGRAAENVSLFCPSGFAIATYSFF